jgi:hypothetical protein
VDSVAVLYNELREGKTGLTEKQKESIKKIIRF